MTELPVKLFKIKSEAMKDDFITTIKQKITAKMKKVPELFSLCDNVLLYNDRVVRPKKLQNRIFRDFNTGHPGINRMKSLMRSYVYWPMMDNNIRDMIEKCKGCVLAAKALPTTFKPWPKTEQPWSRIHVDFAGPLEDFYCLIVVDSYSKWPEVVRCRRPTTGTTNGFLHELFARKPIHISRFQGVLRNLPNKAHNHTAISPKIKRPGWKFCRHVKVSTQKSIRHPDGQGTTAISAGIQNHTQSQYITSSLTSRDYVCQKDKIHLR